MGVVYKARHLRLNRVVALKMMLAGDFASVELRGRFQREAEAVARLQHPNVVQLYEIGDVGNKPSLSLEFVAGHSLAERLRGTPMLPRDAAWLVEVLARAIHHAHAQGIVHRDLKPANILLQTADCRLQNEEGKPSPQSATVNPQSAIPKITDFGLVKRLDEMRATDALAAILGTPSYMAPEQARGDGQQIGPATDIYALGAILYELLTGRPPFLVPSAYDTIALVLNADPMPVRKLQAKVAKDLETICLKCLQKDPLQRYSSALALADDLQCFLDNRPIRARPTGAVQRVGKWARRRPALATLVVLALAATVATLAWIARDGRALGLARRGVLCRPAHALLGRATGKQRSGPAASRPRPSLQAGGPLALPVLANLAVERQPLHRRAPACD